MVLTLVLWCSPESIYTLPCRPRGMAGTVNMALHDLSATSHSPSRVMYVTSKPVEFLALHRQDLRSFCNTNSKPGAVRAFSCHVVKTKSWDKFYSRFSIAKGHTRARGDLARFGNAALAAMSQLKCGQIRGWCRALVAAFTPRSYTDLQRLSLISKQIVIIVRTVASAGGGKGPLCKLISGMWHSESALAHRTRP